MDVPNATIQLHHASSRDCKKCKTTGFNVLGAIDAVTKQVFAVMNETYINAES